MSELQFAPINRAHLALYPIVERADMVGYCAERGAKTIQLRIKDLDDDAVEQEIIAAVNHAKQFNLQLFVNDYWQLAIKHQAYGVHLGQTDLVNADLHALASNNIRLGVSTHCVEEITPSLDLKPSYLAYGPIYFTTSKDMPFTPRGLGRLQHWCQTLDYPIVAIGGITKENYQHVLDAGASGVAFIGAVKDFFPEQSGTTQCL